jgi:hypothetical protein
MPSGTVVYRAYHAIRPSPDSPDSRAANPTVTSAAAMVWIKEIAVARVSLGPIRGWTIQVQDSGLLPPCRG